MLKLIHKIKASDSHIRRCTHYLQVVLVFFIISFFISDNITAQKKSYDNKKTKRNYYNNYDKSSSSKSSAVNVNYHNDKQRNKDYSDNYESNRRTKSDSYTKNEKDFRNNENEHPENYFRIDKSKTSLWDGKHWNESNFPLKIFVKESSSRYYKSDYKDYIKYAMDVWRKADDRIQYRFVKNADDADVALIFVENLGEKYEDSYLGLTDYETYESNEIKFSKIQISLIKNGDEKISAGEIKATIIHELGHAFGLGHSESENDLMYPYISPEHTSEMTYDELSKGDKLAVKDVINLSFEDNYVWK
ncbi:MAG: matrixin family metalloprotease [Ignavibacteria bacterium]|nr:matrixin family metalloprotease [Ignavibacteria bacterium]